ncbi:hypothetical protein KIW84_074182 [Lathyrus oleraceus]|uniref:DUF7745 domain-containing protein n=1 Tax=Pisum sativum TaxID=3888 RepID=A0A9D4ZY90_PEA|nr:hypothetical protein KIW84_074182 [Pisum sativum]
MESERKNTLTLKFKLPRVDTLLALSSKITHYFHLASTIEEYEKLLGWYVKDHPPFTKLGKLLMPESVAEALHLSIEEVPLGIGPRGFSRKFLEDKEWALEKEGKWVPFNAILALLIYEVILFPNDDDYINHSIITVFVSRNPVPTLVSDVHYCLHTMHEKRKGVVLSCVSLLYTWILSHMPQKGSWVDFFKDLRWSQKFASLTAKALVWYLPTSNIEQVNFGTSSLVVSPSFILPIRLTSRPFSIFSLPDKVNFGAPSLVRYPSLLLPIRLTLGLFSSLSDKVNLGAPSSVSSSYILFLIRLTSGPLSSLYDKVDFEAPSSVRYPSFLFPIRLTYGPFSSLSDKVNFGAPSSVRYSYLPFSIRLTS